MPRREARVSLAQMRDHAKEAVSMARGKTREELDSNRMLNLSLVRLLEIVGEAGSLRRAREAVTREVRRAVALAEELPEGTARTALVHLAQFIATRCGADV